MPLHQPSLVELAADDLRRRILSGQLAQGQRLVEERLSEELGISRPPLREAMRMLEHEGLIVKLPRFGSQVVQLSPHDYWELLTLRHSLESTAFRIAIPVADDRLLDEPRRRLRELEACAPDGEPPEMIQAGYRFHLALVAIAGHHRIVDVYRSLQAQLQLCMALHIQSSPESLQHNAGRHRVLLTAVESGDLDQALAALDAHGHGRFLGAKP
ncbi:MAG TPA: GntR family transcriptional regulator [Pseudonocardiaceae bacterium]|nr:GntR family transcriptional regulator [Pseudonocardiaceae bacterium]